LTYHQTRPKSHRIVGTGVVKVATMEVLASRDQEVRATKAPGLMAEVTEAQTTEDLIEVTTEGIGTAMRSVMTDATGTRAMIKTQGATPGVRIKTPGGTPGVTIVGAKRTVTVTPGVRIKTPGVRIKTPGVRIKTPGGTPGVMIVEAEMTVTGTADVMIVGDQLS